MTKSVSLLFLLPMLSLFSACASQATFTMVDGSRFEGTVLSSTTDKVMIRSSKRLGETGQAPTGQEMLSVDRAELVDVEHPGVGLTIGGSVLAGLGALSIALTMPALLDDSEPEDLAGALLGGIGRTFAVTTLGFGIAAVVSGGIMVAVGATRWSTSVDALEPPLVVTPLVFHDGERMHYGGGLSLRW